MLRVQKTANALAMLDVFASFAYVAERNDYCKPEITDNGIIDIKKGRHPVVETMISNGMFIENDTYLSELYNWADGIKYYGYKIGKNCLFEKFNVENIIGIEKIPVAQQVLKLNCQAGDGR